MTTLSGPVEAFTQWIVEHQEMLVENILTAVWRDGLSDSPFSRDPALVTVVRSETAMLVARFVKGLQSGQQEPIWSPEAQHIARLAALHEIPLDALIASYRVAQGVVQDAFFQAAQEAEISATEVVHVLRLCCSQLSQQIKVILEFVTDEYMDALEASSADENAIRLRVVRSVLNQTGSAIESPFYDLNAEHVAVVAWGAAARALAAFARECGNSAVYAFIDRGVMWAWFSSVGPDQVHEAVLERTPRGRLGTGGSGKGVLGFRQSHLEAQSAYRVCERTGRRNAHFPEVAPEAIGLADLDVARGLVHRHLGQLVGGDSRQSELRKTLEVYLASRHSARSAAVKLGLTERTVANRMQAVRALLPPDTELSSVELALALRLRTLVMGRSAES
ncbi:hypothetical protein NRF20_08900 [Streptomyces sp. R-74717]|uniref:helix-turn-helix domain-containing protein n=1 Tax=Streptomyces TaxID=1883 RepID=UPI0037AF84A6